MELLSKQGIAASGLAKGFLCFLSVEMWNQLCIDSKAITSNKIKPVQRGHWKNSLPQLQHQGIIQLQVTHGPSIAEGGGKPPSLQRGSLNYPVPHPQPGLGQPCQLRGPAATNKRSQRGGWEADGFILLFCNFLFMKMLREAGYGSSFAAQYLLESHLPHRNGNCRRFD